MVSHGVCPRLDSKHLLEAANFKQKLMSQTFAAYPSNMPQTSPNPFPNGLERKFVRFGGILPERGGSCWTRIRGP